MRKFMFFALLLFIFPFSKASAKNNSLSEALNFSIQAPIFSTPPEISSSSRDIVDQVRSILRERLQVINYDRLFPISQFLDHYQKYQKDSTEDILPIDAFKTFRFIPILPTNNGGPCLSLTFDLKNHLPEYLKPYIAIAKLPGKYQQFGFPEYSHTAVLIKFTNPFDPNDKGFVLLDPSFDIDEPIVLKEDGNPFVYDTTVNGIWTFYIKDDQIICEIDNGQTISETAYEGNDYKMFYITNQITNPIECSAMPMILCDRRLSLLSRQENGLHLAHLNVELNKNRVIWDQNGTRFIPISFQQLKDGWSFPNWFANALVLEESLLMQKILRILENKNILDSLYLDYLSIIKSTEDFSITGKLDLSELDEIQKAINN